MTARRYLPRHYLPRRYLPWLVIAALTAYWEFAVAFWDIPKFLLPSPSLVLQACIDHGPDLLWAALQTLKITVIALVSAVITGVALALLFSMNRLFEQALYPLAVILQVTPVISVAPLIVIWVGIDHVDRALVIIAWLAAFFPVLTNLTAGLRQIDRSLSDVFTLYGASPWQRFWFLVWPSALPFLLAGIKVSSGLALIGAVVAEFVAGSGGATGLAWRILEAGNRLQMPKMFAGLFLLSAMGVALFYVLSAIERRLLRRRN